MINANRKSVYFKLLLFIINLIIVLFLTIFIYITTLNISDFFIAREFIAQVNSLPWKPYQNIIISIFLCLILLINFIIKEIFNVFTGKLIYLSFAIDFIVSISIIYILNFNYNGVLFMVIANVITFTKGTKGRYLLMLLSIAGIIIADYELIAIKYDLYSLRDYFGFYNLTTQQYLMGFYNIMISVNIIVFIIYCIYVIQEQRGTINEVKTLYDRLNKTNEELQKANNRLKEYSKIMEKAGETKERNRLAREIHDTLGHTLTGISAGIDACITTIEHSPAEVKKQLELISKVTREGIKDIRRSVSRLRPDALERLNLEAAINKMIKELETVTSANILFESKVETLKFDADEEDAIYRVVQESLTNAIRHGNPTQVWVQIRSEEGEVILTIKDNGVGCKTMKKGFGTRHITERIEMLNGKVTFEGMNGFTVTARIPIRWGEGYD